MRFCRTFGGGGTGKPRFSVRRMGLPHVSACCDFGFIKPNPFPTVSRRFYASRAQWCQGGVNVCYRQSPAPSACSNAAEELVEGDRQVPDALAGGVEHRVGYRRRDAGYTDLTDAVRAPGRVRGGAVGVD